MSVAELEAKVKEAEANLAEAKRAAAHQEFPKWIEPHASHVVDKPAVGESPAHKSVPLFPLHHVDRDGRVTVCVDDADHEAKALAEAVKPGSEAPID